MRAILRFRKTLLIIALLLLSHGEVLMQVKFMWSLCGVYMEFMWSLYGVFDEFMWSLYGVYAEFMWSLCWVYVEFMYHACTRMPGECYRIWFRSLLLCLSEWVNCLLWWFVYNDESCWCHCRGLWALAVTAMLGSMIYTLYSMLAAYDQYPVNTLTKVTAKASLPFPGVSTITTLSQDFIALLT